ncbi:non-homologous end-joining DNA ligase [Saccharothrix sp. SC076]|nr:non-homologous end-joining DNA ligase [Saccharothrix obliqua]
MLASTGPVPSGPGLAVEFKWDGYRALAYCAGHAIRLQSRNDLPLIGAYPEVGVLPDLLAGRAAVLDGEVVALDDRGRPDFGLLQQRSAPLARPTRVAYFVFDLLHLDHRSLLTAPYTERRALLTALALPGEHAVQVPPYWLDTSPDTLLHVADQHGLEGIMVKRASSRYEPGRRSPAWTKVPLRRTQDVVIGGWLPGQGRRAGVLGSLLMGVYEDDALRYVGNVGTGTGWTERFLVDLTDRLRRLAGGNPFDDAVPTAYARRAHWVRPELVGAVHYRAWTSDNRLRQPSFHGLRPDIDPASVRRA